MRKLRPLTAAVVIAAMAGAGTAQAQSSQAQNGKSANAAAAGTSAHAQQLSNQDRDFMKNAAQANKAEVQASRLALRKATDPATKEFAQNMIDDHTKAQDKLQEIARQKGMQLPSEPSVAQKSTLDGLRAANGSEFDRKFAEELGIDAHHKAIDLFRKESDQGRDPEVKSFAGTTLPKLEHHLQMAQNMQAKVEHGASNPTIAGAAASNMGPNASQAANHASRPAKKMSKSEKADELKDAQQNIHEAVQIVQKMKLDPELRGELQKAKGLFILPDYGRAALGVGGQGGEGVLVTHEGGHTFSAPVFYNMGGVSLGLQAGASGGEVAMLLMTDRAVQDFKSGNQFSINADAGLTIVSFSARAQASAGKVQDIIVWSNTKGAYAGASVAVTDVVPDKEANSAYYSKEGVTPAQIIAGQVQRPRKNELGQELASL